MSKKIFLRTFGCQMNERDSELIAGMLKEKGYKIVDKEEDANEEDEKEEIGVEAVNE